MAWSDQIPAPKSRIVEAETHDFIVARLAKGYPPAAVARMAGCSIAAVHYITSLSAVKASPAPPAKRPKPRRASQLPKDWRPSIPGQVKAVLKRVAEKHGLNVEDLTGQSRVDRIIP